MYTEVKSYVIIYEHATKMFSCFRLMYPFHVVFNHHICNLGLAPLHNDLTVEVELANVPDRHIIAFTVSYNLSQLRLQNHVHYFHVHFL
jgi:hypothetical protein